MQHGGFACPSERGKVHIEPSSPSGSRPSEKEERLRKRKKQNMCSDHIICQTGNVVLCHTQYPPFPELDPMPKYADTMAAGIDRACHASALSRYAGAGWESLRAQNHEWFDLSPVFASCLHSPESGYRPGPFVLPLAQVLSDRSGSNETVYGLLVGLNGFASCRRIDFCCVIHTPLSIGLNHGFLYCLFSCSYIMHLLTSSMGSAPWRMEQ